MKKPIAIGLIFLLLISNVQLSYGKHFCGGLEVVAEWMLGHQHLDCGMGMMDEENPHLPESTRFDVPACCDNTYTPAANYSVATLQADQEIVPDLYPISVQHFSVEVTAFSNRKPDRHPVTRPPPLEVPLRLALFQQYLI